MTELGALRCNKICLFADSFLEFFGFHWRETENCLSDSEMEKFLLNLGIHHDFVGEIGEQYGNINIFNKPGLAYELMDESQRNHVLSFELLPSADAGLVGLAQTEFREVLYHGDEDVFRIIFFK